jgi:23S rRNA (adenine-N6)-dimethyltransferase
VSGGRPSRSSPAGAHFLPSWLAAELVSRAEVCADELVLDLGAGAGALTAPLARAGARVLAVERDARLAGRLRRRFADQPAVRVVADDVCRIPLPRKGFRVVANIPFGVTTRLLTRLLDDSSALRAADIVVAAGVCRALTAPRPANPATLWWSTRFDLSAGRRVAATCFSPPPSVDAGVLVVRRRPRDLVVGPQRRAFGTLVEAGYSRPGLPWEQAVSRVLTRRQIVRLTRDRELPRNGPVTALTVHDWAEMARLAAR